MADLAQPSAPSGAPLSLRGLVEAQWNEKAVPRRTFVYALSLFAGFFLFLGGLAATAPIDSASSASGVLNVESNTQGIQHLEGGTIETIHVRDGSEVGVGDPLITLDGTRAEMAHGILSTRLLEGRVRAARLRAERGGLAFLPFDFSEEESAATGFLQAFTGEQNVFDARREAIAAQEEILSKRIAQLRAEISGFEQQIAAFERQKALLEEETSGVALLVGKGLEKNARLLNLKRAQADIDRQLGISRSSIARTGQRIGETELQATNIRLTFLNEVVEELVEVEKQNFDIQERLVEARKVLERTVLRAPVAGVVVGLEVFTEGGVISAGQRVMSVVPRNDSLIVEARINPNDIDDVAAGLPARVRLLAFSQRSVDIVPGRVEQVSADRLVDGRSGQSYFLARVRLDSAEIPPEIAGRLVPGMAAEVMIRTGEHTILEYLTKPIRQSLSRALIEK